MAILVCQNGALRLTVAYVVPWKGGVFYYQRRVPVDMKKHYPGKSLIRESLKTRDPVVAARAATKLAAEHDALWKSLRSPEAQEQGLTTPETRAAGTALLKKIGLRPGEGRQGDETSQEMAWEKLDDYIGLMNGPEYVAIRHHLNSRPEEINALLSPVQVEAQNQLLSRKPVVHLSDALGAYLRLKGRDTNSKFALDTKRSIQMVIAIVGDLPLEAYTRQHATKVRDSFLIGGNKTATVARRLNSIVAVINKALREYGLDCRNHFSGLDIPNEEKDATPRLPFTLPELRQIAAATHERDDAIRHIIALQLDTGARAGEIIGLRTEDVVLDHAVPHVRIRPHEKLGRTLKNAQSERNVPLIGEALWAAKRAVAAAKANKASGGWLFPRYIENGTIKATHAENTINKWLRSLPGIDKTTHSFRHAMRDRLREAHAPEEIQEVIGGWGSRSVGQGYGVGYSLELLLGHMEKVVLKA